MGKDLKGKELGVGISQQKDGLYVGRFVNRSGKRVTKRFKKLQECRQWIADAEFENEHNDINALGDMTVDAWYEYWMETHKSGFRFNTYKSYSNRYRLNIKPVIGNKMISDVRPVHCQDIFNRMAKEGYSISSVKLTRRLLHCLFEFADDNELINGNPCKRSLKSRMGESTEKKTALTIEQQNRFLKHAASSNQYDQFRFVLQTGIRCAELVGLKWEDVDFKKRTLSIRRNVNYVYELKEWKIGEPKTESSKRTIPLTDEAISILKAQKQKNIITSIEWADYIFLSPKGVPVLPNTYNASIYRICRQAGLPRCSMHILRHTFATRCIEGGMKPKTLQAILGHADVGTTMNLYVHTTEEEKVKEIQLIQDSLSVI